MERPRIDVLLNCFASPVRSVANLSEVESSSVWSAENRIPTASEDKNLLDTTRSERIVAQPLAITSLTANPQVSFGPLDEAQDISNSVPNRHGTLILKSNKMNILG